jgi:GGDEF domain-containing protein
MSTSPWTPVDESASAWEPVEEPVSKPKPEGLAAKAWRIANKPLLTPGQTIASPLAAQGAGGDFLGSLIDRGLTAARQYATSPPKQKQKSLAETHPVVAGIVSRLVPEAQGVVNTPGGLEALVKGYAGAMSDTGESVSSMSSPLGLATAGLGEAAQAPGAVGRLAQAGQTLAGVGFGAEGARQAVGGVNQMTREGVTPENLQATLQGTGQALLGGAGVGHAAHEYIPSTKRAGQGMATLLERHGEGMPVTVNSLSAVDKILKERESTARGTPETFKAYQERHKVGDIKPDSTLGKQITEAGFDPTAPITFGELKWWKDAFNEIKQHGPEAVRKVAGSIAGKIAKEQQAHANVSGFGKDWASQIKEYRRGKQIVRGAEKAGPVVGSLVGGYLGRGGGNLAAAEAATMGGVAGRYLGKPVIGSLARSIIEREGTPRLAEPPTPPQAPSTGGRRTSGVNVPADMERRIGGERRGDAAAREAFAKLSPEEQYKAAYTSPVTGLPSGRAFESVSGWRKNPKTKLWEQIGQPTNRPIGMSDVAGLKWINEEYGMPGGDSLLQAKADALRAEGLEGYHTGGDEFHVIGPEGMSQPELAARLESANARLSDTGIEVTNPKTGKVELYKGAEFRHGVGSTPMEAEQGMLARKAAAKNTRGKQGTLYRVTQ